MSFHNEFLGKVNDVIGRLENTFELKDGEKVTDTEQKPTASSHNYLTVEERKAFTGLCALEGKSEVEKLAELVKEYLDKKKKRL